MSRSKLDHCAREKGFGGKNLGEVTGNTIIIRIGNVIKQIPQQPRKGARDRQPRFTVFPLVGGESESEPQPPLTNILDADGRGWTGMEKEEAMLEMARVAKGEMISPVAPRSLSYRCSARGGVWSGEASSFPTWRLS